jgi:hypothetical protein
MWLDAPGLALITKMLASSQLVTSIYGNLLTVGLEIKS